MELQVLPPRYDDETLKTTVEAIGWYAAQIKELTNLALLFEKAEEIYRFEKCTRNVRKVKMKG